MEPAACRGSSHTLPLFSQLQTQPKTNLQVQTTPARGRKVFSRPSNSPANESCHNSANEKLLYFKLLVYANGLFVSNSLPNPPLRSVKSVPLFCFVVVWFCWSFLVPNCNSLLFLNKTIFVTKLLFYLKV